MASTEYSNDTMKLFNKLNTALYFCGMTDFWIETVNLPKKVVKMYNFISIFIEIFMFSFMASEVMSYFTQRSLSPKQAADRLGFGVSHVLLYIYVMNLRYYKGDVREVLRCLAVDLKRVHNDMKVEVQMISKLKFYLSAFVTSCGLCLVFYGASALVVYLRTGAPFTTLITAWPDVADPSRSAHVARVIIYFLWWGYFTRVSGSYILILSMFICLSCQYTNLTTYFEKLGEIYKKRGLRSNLDEEYETALKVGIKLHIDTIWCSQECQKIYNIIFSSQLVMTIAELICVMATMMTSEHSLVTLAAAMSTACGALISTGFLMWNAGDVTVEAAKLPAALYASGWQLSEGAVSTRVRKLLTLSITQAQKPVVFMAFGCVEISYQTYVSIVKSSYSVFSVMY